MPRPPKIFHNLQVVFQIQTHVQNKSPYLDTGWPILQYLLSLSHSYGELRRPRSVEIPRLNTKLPKAVRDIALEVEMEPHQITFR